MAQPHPRIDGDASIRPCNHRIEVELGELRKILSQSRKAMQKVGDCRDICRRRALVARNELAGLARVDELIRIYIGERRDPKAGLSDQLGQHATRAEGDQRPEGRVLDDAGEQLDAAFDHGLDEHGWADPGDCGSHRGLIDEPERDSAALSLVSSGCGGLDDDGEAEFEGRCDRLVFRSGLAFRNKRDAVRLEQSPCPSRVEPELVGSAERVGRNGVRIHRINAVEFRDSSRRAPQPFGSLGGQAECVRR